MSTTTDVAEHSQADGARLAAVERYRLDLPVDGGALGTVAQLAADLCGVPAAQVNVVAAESQLTKAWYGLEGDVLPREQSFCAIAIGEQQGLLVVEDATRDVRFDRNPLVVGSPEIRFYAGQVLRSADGHPLGALCVLDFRPRRLAVVQLQALERLARLAEAQLELHRLVVQERRLNGIRDEFVASTAHDFRNPLAVISGYASLLARDQLAAEQLQALTYIEQAALRIGEMIDNYLAVALIGEGGDLPLRLEPVPLGELLHGIAAAFAPFARVAQVDVLADAPEELIVEADRFRLTQAIENLLGNALKYTQPGGRVTLELELEAAHALLRVRDTGVGMSAADRERLMERFFRAETAHRHGVKGTGLGLMAVRRIVRAHRGRLEVESDEGVGSVFTLRLPLRQRGADEIAPAG